MKEPTNRSHSISMYHETCIRGSWHTYRWVMSHMWISQVTRIHESCHKYEWVRSHIWMSQVTHMNESDHTYEWIRSHISMSHVTHMNESCHPHEGVKSRLCHDPPIGWLQSVGSIKLQVSLPEYRLFYRALLQKRPII